MCAGPDSPSLQGGAPVWLSGSEGSLEGQRGVERVRVGIIRVGLLRVRSQESV